MNVGGDLDRHNAIWGGSYIDSFEKQEESAPIVDFTTELSLQNLLPAGEITFEDERSRTWTIDMILTTPRATHDLSKRMP